MSSDPTVETGQGGVPVDIDRLARLGVAFDDLIDDVSIEGESQPVEVEALLARYENEIDVEAVKREIAMLPSRAARFYVARKIAARLIANTSRECGSTHDTDGSCEPPVCATIHAFADAKKLETSAYDILASAIVLPKASFKASMESDKDITGVAAEFGVPLGAVALRRRVLDAAG